MARPVAILLLHINDIFLLENTIDDVKKQLKVLHALCKNHELNINIDETKIMIVKSKKKKYPPILYSDDIFEEVNSYKYLAIDFNCHLNKNHGIEKQAPQC
jgi:hypothetical protein